MNFIPQKNHQMSQNILRQQNRRKKRIKKCIEKVKKKMKEKKGNELNLKGANRCFKVSITMPKIDNPQEPEKISFLVKKVLNNQDFQKERKLLSQIKHTNIVRYFDHFIIGNYHCLVMEYLSFSLKKCLLRGLPQYTLLVKSIIFQILHALHYLHRNDIIHRDISDNNIMLTAGGRVKLIDFDSSKDTGQTGNPVTTTGTPGFQSPEMLLLDSENYESRMDIFALGLVAHLCYYGYSFHYDCPNTLNLYQHILVKIEELKGRRDFASEDERMFHKFLVGCLREDPKDRSRAADLLQLEWFEDMWTLERRGELYRFTRGELRKLENA